jgi:hypothetical protein
MVAEYLQVYAVLMVYECSQQENLLWENQSIALGWTLTWKTWSQFFLVTPCSRTSELNFIANHRDPWLQFLMGIKWDILKNESNPS